MVFTIPGIRGTIRVHNQRTAAWLRRTYRDALRGDAEAQWHIGVQLKSADHPGLLPVDDHAAFKWLVRAARGGATAGWSQVACAYKDGIGVRRDRKKAFALVYASALEGDLASMMNVGRFYRDGIGVKRDVAHGVAILEDVVNRGFTFAAY